MTFRTTALRLSVTATVCCTLLLTTRPGSAGDKKDEANKNSAVTPAPREKGWMKRHEGFVEIAKKGGVDVLFLGDSITDGWRKQQAWKKYFEPLKAANFGIGGDRTEHVLWRIRNGELDGIKPKVIVLMIGTNNTPYNSAEQIADGVKMIIQTLHARTAESKILLLAVFPRADRKTGQLVSKVDDINKIIAKVADQRHVLYMDIGQKFLTPEGGMTKEIMPDYLHLSPRGYEIWGEAIAPTVEKMLGKEVPNT
jgi:lysophospholipase L1-like esterase